MRNETLQRLATDVIALLERDGVKALDRFARISVRPLRHNGEAYRGGNALSLWATAELRGYTSPFWMTFKQALEYGACVRKGEKSSLAVFFDRRPGDPDDPEDKGFFIAKAYPVFNACQIDGLPEKFFPAMQQQPGGFDPIPAAEAFVAATGAEIREGQRGPFYKRRDPRGGGDWIGMPSRAAYREAEGFYADLLHELVHWTGDEKRLDRTKGKRFGDPDYALEELVAEIGAAMLCAEIGLSKTMREDHAPYLANWLRALKSDPRHLWTAGSAADKAVSYLQDLQPKEAKSAA